MVKSHFEHDGQGSLTLLTLKGGPSILPRRPLFFGRRIFNAIHSAGKTYLNQSSRRVPSSSGVGKRRARSSIQETEATTTSLSSFVPSWLGPMKNLSL